MKQARQIEVAKCQVAPLPNTHTHRSKGRPIDRVNYESRAGNEGMNESKEYEDRATSDESGACKAVELFPLWRHIKSPFRIE